MWCVPLPTSAGKCSSRSHVPGFACREHVLCPGHSWSLTISLTASTDGGCRPEYMQTDWLSRSAGWPVRWLMLARWPQIAPWTIWTWADARVYSMGSARPRCGWALVIMLLWRKRKCNKPLFLDFTLQITFQTAWHTSCVLVLFYSNMRFATFDPNIV